MHNSIQAEGRGVSTTSLPYSWRQPEHRLGFLSELLPTNLLHMGSRESEVMAWFWKGNFITPVLLTAERRESKESYTLSRAMGGWTEIFGLEATQCTLKTGCLNTWLAFGGLSCGEAKPSHLLQKVSSTQSRGRRFPLGKSLWALKLSVPLANSVYLNTAQNPGKTISHLPCFNISHFLLDWGSSPTGFTSTTAGVFSLPQLTIVTTMAANWGCRF